jgi:hypothetical protein
LKALEEQKAQSQKQIDENKHKIALADTVTSFLARKSDADFEGFYSMVEHARKTREGKPFTIPALAPLIEEEVRLEALKCFQGDIVSKSEYKALWDEKERIRKEKNVLEDKINGLEAESSKKESELAAAKKEIEMMAAIKVFSDGQPRTLSDLLEYVIVKLEGEIDKRASQKFDAQTARTYGLLEWLDDKLGRR